MPRTCLACTSPDRETIDRALVSREPLRNIAKRVSISPAGLLRHKNHVAGAIQQTQAQREEQFGESVLDEMRRVHRKAWELLGKMESEGDHRGSIVALREVRECVESLDEMLAKAAARPPVRDERCDYSRLSDEQLQQFRALLAVAYGVDSLEDALREEFGPHAG